MSTDTHKALSEAATDLNESFSIQVHNKNGWYSARYHIAFELGGHEITVGESNITIGLLKSSFVPGSATNVRLKVSEWWGFGWRTIFTQTWPRLDASHCFDIWGTTLSTGWKEVSCS